MNIYKWKRNLLYEFWKDKIAPGIHAGVSACNSGRFQENRNNVAVIKEKIAIMLIVSNIAIVVNRRKNYAKIFSKGNLNLYFILLSVVLKISKYEIHTHTHSQKKENIMEFSFSMHHSEFTLLFLFSHHHPPLLPL